VQREVTAELDLEVAASADLVFSIAATAGTHLAAEQLTFHQGGRALAAAELVDAAGSRLHRVTSGAGSLQARYRATISGAPAASGATELDLITSLRPSRYCPSDELFADARRRFGGLHGAALVAAVEEFVAGSIVYAPGSSQGTDSAATTLATGHGVCRDFAHLVIALLRALDVPARYVSCYAPGLVPMDFHAVAEVHVDGAWSIVDATRLADPSTLVRIATGRDAADCAFLSYHGAHVELTRLHVDARPVGSGGTASATWRSRR